MIIRIPYAGKILKIQITEEEMEQVLMDNIDLDTKIIAKTEEKIKVVKAPRPKVAVTRRSLVDVTQALRDEQAVEDEEFVAEIKGPTHNLSPMAVAINNDINKPKRVSHSSQDEYYCQNANCPTKSKRHVKKEMFEKGIFLYCSQECAR